jgi:hypothetical protein
MGGLSREGCTLVSPKPTPKPCSGVIPSNLPAQSSPFRVGGAGRNRATGCSTRLNRKLKSWKVRESKPSCVLGKILLWTGLLVYRRKR